MSKLNETLEQFLRDDSVRSAYNENGLEYFCRDPEIFATVQDIEFQNLLQQYRSASEALAHYIDSKLSNEIK